MIIALNGVAVKSEEAVISVYDHGFLYGMGLFETFRTYGGVPYLLNRHLKRLAEGCRELGVQYDPDEAAISRLVGTLLEANGFREGYFRLSVSAGVEMLGLPGGDYGKPVEILYVKPLPPRDELLYAEGKALQLLRLRRNTPEGDFGRLKSFHYMNPILGKRELNAYPWSTGAEGLFLDSDGHVAEGIVSNVFMVKNGHILTPPLSTGILGGITREWVLETAEVIGYSLRKELFTWPEIISAQEVFITNSIQEIVPVSRLFNTEGKSYLVGTGKPGEVTVRFINKYHEDAWSGRPDKASGNGGGSQN